MAITPTTLRAKFTEVSDVAAYPDARLQVFIDEAALFIGACFAGFSDSAQSYLSMHLLSVGDSTSGSIEDAEGGAIGAIQSEAAGAVNYSRAVNAIDQNHPDAFYLSTTYGQQFLHIRKTACVGGFMVV